MYDKLSFWHTENVHANVVFWCLLLFTTDSPALSYGTMEDAPGTSVCEGNPEDYPQGNYDSNIESIVIFKKKHRKESAKKRKTEKAVAEVVIKLQKKKRKKKGSLDGSGGDCQTDWQKSQNCIERYSLQNKEYVDNKKSNITKKRKRKSSVDSKQLSGNEKKRVEKEVYGNYKGKLQASSVNVENGAELDVGVDVITISDSENDPEASKDQGSSECTDDCHSRHAPLIVPMMTWSPYSVPIERDLPFTATSLFTGIYSLPPNKIEDLQEPVFMDWYYFREDTNNRKHEVVTEFWTPPYLELQHTLDFETIPTSFKNLWTSQNIQNTWDRRIIVLPPKFQHCRSVLHKFVRTMEDDNFVSISKPMSSFQVQGESYRETKNVLFDDAIEVVQRVGNDTKITPSYSKKMIDGLKPQRKMVFENKP